VAGPGLTGRAGRRSPASFPEKVGIMGGSYKDLENGCGDLLAFLQSQRSLFETDEEYKAFVVSSVRRFVIDLRTLGIEVSMRPTYLEKSAVGYSSPQVSS